MYKIPLELCEMGSCGGKEDFEKERKHFGRGGRKRCVSIKHIKSEFVESTRGYKMIHFSALMSSQRSAWKMTTQI